MLSRSANRSKHLTGVLTPDLYVWALYQRTEAVKLSGASQACRIQVSVLFDREMSPPYRWVATPSVVVNAIQ